MTDKLKPCPLHRRDPDDRLSYMARADKAEKRLSAGESQLRCPACKFYVWKRLFKKNRRAEVKDEQA